MIKVCIADDHEIVRTGLKRILSETGDISIVSEAASVEELMDAIKNSAISVLVLDVNMPGSEGVQTINRILSLKGDIKIVVFTMYNEDSHAVAFLRAGAFAFINKRLQTSELIEAIRKAHSGKRHITQTLAEYLFEQGIDIQKKPHESLSQREYTVFLKLAQGEKSTNIAESMNISVSTVNTFVQRIKTKLGAKTILQIVDYARGNNLV